jgi:hypothetical protein
MNYQHRPTCILIEAASHYDWLNSLVVRRLRQDGPVRLIVLAEASEAEVRGRFGSLLQADDKVVLRASVDSLKRKTAEEDAPAIYAEARAFEARFGFLYIRDIIGQDRRFADAFQGEKHPMARHPRDSNVSLLQLTAYINYCYRLYEELLQKEGVDLLITRPDGIALAPLVQTAKYFSIPHTCPHVANHQARAWWNYGAYRGDTMLRDALTRRIHEPQTIKTLDYDIRHIYKAFQNFTQLASLRTILTDALRFSVIRAHMLFSDICRGRLNQRSSFSRTLGQYWLRFRNGQWLQRHGIRDAAELQGAPFLLLLLPTEPEYNTHSQAREFWHPEAIIRQISICLPSGYTLVLKEHSGNLGNRYSTFYERMARMPNIVWSDHRILGTALAKDATAVGTCAGTIALESALLGKPCLVLSQDFIFSFLPHVTVVDSMRTMKQAITEVTRKRTSAEIDYYKEYGSRVYRAIEDISFDISDTIIYGGPKKTIEPAEMERCHSLLLDCYQRQLRELGGAQVAHHDELKEAKIGA